MKTERASRLVPLNLPKVEGLRIRKKCAADNSILEVWDDLRGRWLVLTPEEWVRRHFIGYLISVCGVVPHCIAQEVRVDNAWRADIVIYDKSARVVAIVECKAPQVKLSIDTAEQIARYNHYLDARYLILTNGVEHRYYCVDKCEKKIYEIADPKYLEF